MLHAICHGGRGTGRALLAVLVFLTVISLLALLLPALALAQPTPVPSLVQSVAGRIGAITISLGDVLVAEQGGRAASYREEDGQRVMQQAEILVRVELGRGAASTAVWTCDFSYDYVRINADYRS